MYSSDAGCYVNYRFESLEKEQQEKSPILWAFAEPNNPIADENVHENTPGGFGGKQDQAYHEGTCQGGSDSPACDLDIITDPGNSDDHRQDD